MLVAQVGPLHFSIKWVISNLAQKFSFVINRFDSHAHPNLSSLPDGEETDRLAVTIREAYISKILLLAGLSQEL